VQEAAAGLGQRVPLDERALLHAAVLDLFADTPREADDKSDNASPAHVSECRAKHAHDT
jgi:hypothetical protein